MTNILLKKMKKLLEIYPKGVYNAIKLVKTNGNESGREENVMEGTCCCSQKTKKRSEEEYKKLVNRLNRIEGQVRGIKRMLEEDAYCTDILIQVSAINSALNSFNKTLLAEHIRTCVANDIREGKDETIDELVETLQKLMK